MNVLAVKLDKVFIIIAICFAIVPNFAIRIAMSIVYTNTMFDWLSAISCNRNLLHLKLGWFTIYYTTFSGDRAGFHENSAFVIVPEC